MKKVKKVKTKNLAVYDDDSLSIYTLKKNKESGEITLRTSSFDVAWSVSDQFLLSIKDDGNGYKLKLEGDKTLALDYAQLQYLALVLPEVCSAVVRRTENVQPLSTPKKGLK